MSSTVVDAARRSHIVLELELELELVLVLELVLWFRTSRTGVSGHPD
ncbi:MAG TPA: hypothetical protein H9881_04830 [Candidatus Stackebrandtia excrementipullorum]|nr:hypothetical protein [Candidatus Stackebrandtia excrementipullorum]